MAAERAGACETAHTPADSHKIATRGVPELPRKAPILFCPSRGAALWWARPVSAGGKPAGSIPGPL